MLTSFFYIENKKVTIIFKKCVLFAPLCTCYSCPILIHLELSRQIFENFSNIKFHENSSLGSQVVLCGEHDGRTDGRTDGKTGRHDEPNNRFRNVLNAPN